MGRIGVGYEEVALAASEVQGEGRAPTVDAVRQKIGTGSKSTIANHLRSWRSQQGIERASEAALPEELLGLVRGLWLRLRDSCEQKAYEYQCESDAKVASMQQRFAEIQQQDQVLQAQIHQLEEKLQRALEHQQTLQTSLAIEQQDKATLTERAASLENHGQTQQQEIERLHQLLKHVQHNLEHYQAATQQLRQEQSIIAEKQRADYEQKLAEQQEHIATLAQEKSHYQAQAEQLKIVCDKVQEDYHTLHQTQQKTQTDYHTISLTHDALKQQHLILTENHQVLVQRSESNQKIIIEHEIQSKADAAKIVSLEATLAKYEDKIQALRQDYQFIAQEKANLEGQIQQLNFKLKSNAIAD